MSATTRRVEQYFQEAGLGAADLCSVLDAVAHHFDVPVTVMAPRPTPGASHCVDQAVTKAPYPSSNTVGTPAG